MEQPASDLKYGSFIKGHKVHREPVLRPLLLPIPVTLFFIGLLLRGYQLGLALASIAVIFMGIWMASKAIWGWIFMEDGRLVRTFFGAVDIVIDPKDVTAFYYQKVIAVRHGWETKVLSIEWKGQIKPMPLHNAGAWIHTTSWGNRQHEFFTNLANWVARTPVQLDTTTKEKLQELTR